MTKHIFMAAVLACGAVGSVFVAADESKKPEAGAAQPQAPAPASVEAILDKAAEALGGKDKLAAMKGATWSAKGTVTIGEVDAAFTATLTFEGHDKRRLEFETELANNPIKAVVVVNGEKAWRRVNGNTDELAGDDLANERRMAWREWTPVAVLLLKSAPFKTEPAGEVDVNGKPAAGVKVTGPAGGPFTLYFDKATGLPVRQTATVKTFTGDDANEEITYSEYKDFGGVKKATKVETKHDGQKFLTAEVTSFKVIDSPDEKLFERPE